MSVKSKSFLYALYLYGALLAAALNALSAVAAPTPHEVRLNISSLELAKEPPMKTAEVTPKAVAPTKEPRKTTEISKPKKVVVVERKQNAVLPVKNQTKEQNQTVQPEKVAHSIIEKAKSEPTTSATLSSESQSKPREKADEKDEYYKKHLGAIRDEIVKHRVYPELARRLGLQGANSVVFTLTPEGKISQMKVVKSSGFSLLDSSSVKTIESAAASFPKPPLPVQLEIPMEYRLTN